MVLEYAGKAMFFINQLPKKCFFKLDLQWNDFNRDFGFWFVVF
jgi:hypothetical protein